MTNNVEVIEFRILFGRVYIYATGFPVSRHGFRYRPLCEVLDVPSYQTKILVEALSGPDQGLKFTCTPENFSRRYELAPVEATDGTSGEQRAESVPGAAAPAENPGVAK